METGLDNITRREFFGFLAALGMPSLWARGNESAKRPIASNTTTEEYYNIAISKLPPVFGIYRGGVGDCLDMLLEMDKRFPSSADAHFIAANACLCDNRKKTEEKLKETFERYSRAIELDNTLDEAHVNRAVIRCLMAGPNADDITRMIEQAKMGEFEKALLVPSYRREALDDAIIDIGSEHSFSAHYNKALFLEFSGHNKEALEEFTKAIETGFRNYDSLSPPEFKDEKTTQSLIGAVPFSIVGAVPKYIKDMYATYRIGEDRLVLLDPSLIYLQNEKEPIAFAYFYKGMCCAQPSMKKYKDAIAYFNHAIYHNPNVPRFYEMLAVIQYGTGQLEDYVQTRQKLGALMGRLQNLINQVNKKSELK